MPHAIRFHPQRELERGGRHVLKIVGAIEVRRAVDRGRADFLHGLEELVVVILGALEHQVLEEMREPRLPQALILRADVVPEIHRDDRRLAIGMDDDGQAIVQLEFFVRDQGLVGEARTPRTRGDQRQRSGHQQAPRARVANVFEPHVRDPRCFVCRAPSIVTGTDWRRLAYYSQHLGPARSYRRCFPATDC